MKTPVSIISMALQALLVLGCSESSPPSTGVPGSMSRFAVAAGHLYAISAASLQIFELSEPAAPRAIASVEVAFDIETIFSHGERLYIGAQSGVHIYDNSTPSAPAPLAVLTHARSCDPVVVHDTYAYVTLRSVGSCPGSTNQLDIVDISDATYPVLVSTQPLYGPQGLGIAEDLLFVCDGDDGLKVFNVMDPLTIELIRHEADLVCVDVIVHAGVLITTGDEGITQYAYTGSELTKLSSL